MKTTEKLLFNARAFALILALSVPFANMNSAQVQKTFSWKYPVNMQTELKFDNYNCDMVIHTWEKSEAEYHLTVDVTGRTQEDEDRLMKFLGDYSFSHSGDKVAFSTSFWKNRSTVNGKTTLEIEGQKNIELTEFSMKGELWIPAGHTFDFSSKYSRIDMDDFGGSLHADLYNDHFHGGNVTGALSLSAKYTDMDFRELKGLNAELYNCSLDAYSTDEMSVDSKYSKVNVKNSGNVSIDSYNDKIAVDNTGDIRFSSKYSDLKTLVSGKVTLDCYNGTVGIGSSKEIRLSSKYAEYRLGNTAGIKIGDSYNDKFYVVKSSSLTVDVSKYSVYRIDELLSGLDLADGYNDNITVSVASESLKEFRVNGKYEDIAVGLPRQLDFRLTANIRYPSFNVDEQSFTVKTKISEDSGLQFDGVRGTEKAGMPLVDIRGYEVKFRISEAK